MVLRSKDDGLDRVTRNHRGSDGTADAPHGSAGMANAPGAKSGMADAAKPVAIRAVQVTGEVEKSVVAEEVKSKSLKFGSSALSLSSFLRDQRS